MVKCFPGSILSESNMELNVGKIVFLVLCVSSLVLLSLATDVWSCSNFEGYKACKNHSTLISVERVTFIVDADEYSLLIIDDEIDEIAPYAFQKLTWMRNLYLKFTRGVLRLNLKSFSGLDFLALLHITSVIVLQENLFRPVHKIRELQISYNGREQTLNEGLPELSLLEKLRITRVEFGNMSNIHICNVQPRIEQMYFFENYIKSIKSETFSKMKNLYSIEFDENQLEKIEPGAFRGLEYLETISIHESQYSFIEKGVFGGLKGLRVLNLFGSNVSHVVNDAFAGLDLYELNLGHNFLSYLPSGMLNGLRGLISLDLEFNYISYIPMNYFSESPFLKRLLLGGNKISHFGFEAFAGPSLAVLDLQKNQLKTIQNGSLQKLKTKVLNIQKNYVSSIETGALKNSTIDQVCFNYHPAIVEEITSGFMNLSNPAVYTDYSLYSEVCFLKSLNHSILI